MEISDLEQKQAFLREEILEKGYEPEDFLNFLVFKKGENASDLEIYTLNELKEIVNEFLDYQINSKPEVPETVPNLTDVDRIEESIKVEPISIASETILSQNVTRSPDIELYKRSSSTRIGADQFTEVIECLQQDITKLTNLKNVVILISE
jgi:hypothetical protein